MGVATALSAVMNDRSTGDEVIFPPCAGNLETIVHVFVVHEEIFREAADFVEEMPAGHEARARDSFRWAWSSPIGKQRSHAPDASIGERLAQEIRVKKLVGDGWESLQTTGLRGTIAVQESSAHGSRVRQRSKRVKKYV